MITFENIETKEIVTFTGEQEANMRNAHMAAYLNSSDMGPNSGVRGQDFGWRLAPEVVAEMEAVRSDYEALDRISRRLGIGIDDIRDFHILSYVAERDFAKDAKKQIKASEKAENEDDYRARVKAAKSAKAVDNASEVEPASVKMEEPIKANKKEEK